MKSTFIKKRIYWKAAVIWGRRGRGGPVQMGNKNAGLFPVYISMACGYYWQ